MRHGVLAAAALAACGDDESDTVVPLRDTYGVDVGPGENDVLVLAATVAIDQMAHDAAA